MSAVAAEELLPITGGTRNFLTCRNESDALGEFIVERVAGEDCSSFLIDLSDDVGCRSRALYSQDQLVIESHRQSSFPCGAIAQAQQRDLYRGVKRSKQKQFLRYAVTGVLED